jgi:type IV pilus assembly protein PilA
MDKKINKKKGFTLIEIMVAIAIMAILTAVILVNMQGYAKDARASKASAQLSGVVPAIYSCYGNGGSINWPTQNSTGGGSICSIDPSYGTWPKVGPGTDLSTYFYGNWTNLSLNISSDSWSIEYGSSYVTGDGKAICCNSAMKGCRTLVYLGSGNWENGAQCNPGSPTF